MSTTTSMTQIFTTRTNSGPTYTKIIGDNKGNYPYRVGINTLAHNGEQFDASTECGPSGLYFCEIANVLEWLEHGDQLCIVEPIGQIVQVENAFKTDKLEIVSMMSLHELATWKYLADHAVPVESGKAYKWLTMHGCAEIAKFFFTRIGGNQLEIVDALSNGGASAPFIAAIQKQAVGEFDAMKLIIDTGAHLHLENDFMLEWATRYGHLEVVKFLVERRGVSIYLNNVIALQLAVLYRHFDIVKYFVDQGVDVCVNDNIALTAAAEMGCSEMVDYLSDAAGLPPSSA